MFKKEKFGLPGAMAFFHHDGLVAAWKQAAKFAGNGGRLATMPDIAAARLATKPGEDPWETYYTTLTAEYVGISKSGKRILIVAHGIGPMSNLDGIIKAYKWQFEDKSRRRTGGRITQQEFWDLESGKYGDVHIIDFDKYCKRYKYPFMQVLKSSEAMTDPVLKARLGAYAEQYVLALTAYARVWHREKANIPADKRYTLNAVFDDIIHGKENIVLPPTSVQHACDGADDSSPYVIQIEDASNCCYTYSPEHGHRPIEDGFAFAFLISTGRLIELHHERSQSLVHDVGCHEWSNGVRLVGIQESSSIKSGIHSGPKAYELLRKYWRDLLKPVYPPDVAPIGFCALVQIGEQWFTQYLKKGEDMDTWEPEHVVTSMEKVGEAVLFRTTVGGYHGFFKFGINEVQAIAPPTANAYYFVSEPQNEWHDGNPTHQTAMVQFYRIKADTTKRLIRSEQLSRDYETMMELLEKEGAAA